MTMSTPVINSENRKRLMHASASPRRIARIVPNRSPDVVEVLGPTIEFLTAPEPDDTGPCVMRGMVPPGVFVPLHSHADPELCMLDSGELEALAYSDASFAWVPLTEGDIFYVPADAKHAFRNISSMPATMILISTARIGRFFREIGAPVIPGQQYGSPQPERIHRFLQTAERYGYWNATPEQNAAVGLHIAGLP
jgi:hypothetical protein